MSSNNFRIVSIGDGPSAKQVLLFRDRDETGDEMVTLHAWHPDGDEPDAYVQVESYRFSNDLAAQRFILDFSATSAQDFIDRFQP